ncbi:Linker histone H1/H5, domain H15 [Dillenia turbinata]|uniref:Linker histone H1/H5, domain H15 n=1 Tax=Dillenia turbinata TaxID=194707 RepID=A0AAN8Z5B6_9MAGN
MDPSTTIVTTTELPTLSAEVAAAPAHIAQAANPTPSHVAAPTHPPYAEMITTAIGALKEKNGSSKRAIAKYIEKAYPNLPPTHSALLSHHLKRLKNNGFLVMNKHSYLLPSLAPNPRSAPPPTAPLSPTAPPAVSDLNKRPRRPPKPKPNPNELPVAGLGLADGPPTSPKRRGRPPKPKDEVFTVTVPVADADVVSPTGTEINGPALGTGQAVKRRGRPPKPGVDVTAGAMVAVAGEINGVSADRRGPGRPPKSKAVADVMGPDGLKKITGRPRKNKAQKVSGSSWVSGPRKRGRPNLGAAAASGRATGKPRGRPRKNAVVVVDGVATPAQLPKIKKPRKLSGKPLGRPRKINASGSNKLKFLLYDLNFAKKQSRVKHGVEVLRPQLTNESAVFAAAALQELDELAAIDVNAPFNVQISGLCPFVDIGYELVRDVT